MCCCFARSRWRLENISFRGDGDRRVKMVLFAKGILWKKLFCLSIFGALRSRKGTSPRSAGKIRVKVSLPSARVIRAKQSSLSPLPSLRARQSGNHHHSRVIASGAKQSSLIIFPYKNIYKMIQKLYWIASAFSSLAMTIKRRGTCRTYTKLSCRTCFGISYILQTKISG